MHNRNLMPSTISTASCRSNIVTICKSKLLTCFAFALFAFALISLAGSNTCSAQALKPAEEAFSITPDFVYGHKDGMALTFDVLTPTTNNGLGVCFMVSGGWYSGYFPPADVAKGSLFKKLLDEGYTVFLVRHGSAPRFKVPEAVADVRKAISCIKDNSDKFGVDPERLGVCGGSAGGHLSTMLGTTGKKSERVAAVACYFPPTDLRPYVSSLKSVKDFPALDFDKSLAESVSPALHATDDDAPTLLVHGDQDKLVPLEHSQNLKSELDKVSVPCHLIVIEGAAHGFEGDAKTRAESAVIDWFNKYLKSTEEPNADSK